MYSGEYLDKETQTYYLRARYYSPMIGRFISEDSYWGNSDDSLSLNLYVYCANNPIILIDPSGHRSLKETLELLKNLLYGSFEMGFGLAIDITIMEIIDVSIGAKFVEEYGIYQGELYKDSNTFLGISVGAFNGNIELGAGLESTVRNDFENDDSAVANNPDREWSSDVYFKLVDKVYSISNIVTGADFVEDTDKITLAGASGYVGIGGGLEIGFSDEVMKELCYYSKYTPMPKTEPAPTATTMPTTKKNPVGGIYGGGGTFVYSYLE